MIVAAIEMGNKRCGNAFSLRNEYQDDPLSVNVFLDLIGRPGEIKHRSVVLFDENKKFHSFGFDAEKKYAELADEHEHTTWFFFKHFMMKLSGKGVSKVTFTYK
jgi:hypothetical protein